MLGRVIFERNDRNLTWKTQNKGDFSLTDKVNVNLSSKLQTSLNRRSGASVKDRWLREVKNKVELNYDMTDRLRMQFTADEDWNEDTMNELGKTQLTTNASGLLRYSPARNFWLESGIEHTYDKRFNNNDMGSTGIARMNYRGTPLQSLRNMTTNLEVDSGKSNLKRRQDKVDIKGGVSYGVRDVNVSVDFNSRQKLRGYFSDVDRKNVEEREQLNQDIKLSVSHGNADRYSDKLAIATSFKLGRGKTDDSANDIKESSKYHNNSKLNLGDFKVRASRRLWKWLSAGWEGNYIKDDKDVQKQIRSRTQTDIRTGADLEMSLGSSDSLSAFGWIMRTKIDTPIGVPNDRDELKYETGVKYNHRFSPGFQIAIDFRVLETHYVNIDVSQSAQNKWMKTYLFTPSVVYRPSNNVSLEHRVNLYANYNEYDYEKPTLLRSNITRRFSSETFLNALLTDRIRTHVGLTIEENDYGKLNLQRNKIPAEEGIKRLGDISLEYTLTEWMVIKPRYIYSIRKDWNASGSFLSLYRREVDQTFGVECKLFKNQMNDYDFVVGIKRIVRKTNINSPRIRNYVTMRLMYTF